RRDRASGAAPAARPPAGRLLPVGPRPRHRPPVPERGWRLAHRAPHGHPVARHRVSTRRRTGREAPTMTTSKPTTTTQGADDARAGRTGPVALQLTELVLKTARYEEMAAFYTHVLGHGPFFERTPDPDAPPRPAGMPERAVDVRLGF